MTTGPIFVEPSILACDFGKLAAETKRAEDAGADALHLDIMDGPFVPNLSLGTEDVEDILRYIRKCNVKTGLAFCPETSQEMIPKYLTECDLILLMTVDPGFGGQAFMPEILEKVRFTRAACQMRNIRKGGIIPDKASKKQLAPLGIPVDGGINEDTAKLCVEAGANVLVAGAYLYHAPDMKSAI